LATILVAILNGELLPWLRNMFLQTKDIMPFNGTVIYDVAVNCNKTLPSLGL